MLQVKSGKGEILMFTSCTNETCSYFVRQLEDDLETLWQAASRDNRRLQESIADTVRRMKQHEPFRDLELDLPKLPKYVNK